MSEERGSEESLEILRDIWNDFAGLREEAVWVPVVIEEGSNVHPDVCGKARSILRVALAGGTKSEYRQGCLEVLALVDAVNPVGKGFHVTRETFAPGEGAEHA